MDFSSASDIDSDPGCDNDRLSISYPGSESGFDKNAGSEARLTHQHSCQPKDSDGQISQHSYHILNSGRREVA